MPNRRFEIRLIASRRLRAALLLVFALGLLGISLTRLSVAEMSVATLVLCAIFADGWRRAQPPVCALWFDYRPLGCSAVDATGQECTLRCTHASVYPWLAVLQFQSDTGRLPLGMPPTVIVLPDSINPLARADWRRLLVWASLTRRQLASR